MDSPYAIWTILPGKCDFDHSHWHGAKKDSWFSHLAVEVPGEETSNEWLEPVTDEAYGALDG